MNPTKYPVLAMALHFTRPTPNDKHYTTRLLQWENDVSAIAEAIQANDKAFDLGQFINICKGR